MANKRNKWNTFFLYVAGISALLLVVAILSFLTGRNRMRDGVEVTGEISGTNITYSAESTTWYHVVWEYEGEKYKGSYTGSTWTMINRLMHGKGLHPKKGDVVTVYFYPDRPNFYTIDDKNHANNLMLIVTLVLLPCAVLGWYVTRNKKA